TTLFRSNPPRIHSINTPCNHIQQSSSNEPETIPELSGESESSGSSVHARFDTIESRKAVLATDKKNLESLNSILEQNIENDNFFDEYISLRHRLNFSM